MAWMKCQCGEIWWSEMTFDCGIAYEKGYCEVCDNAGEEISVTELYKAIIDE